MEAAYTKKMLFSDIIQPDGSPNRYCCCTGCGDALMSLGAESQGSCFCEKCRIVMFFQTDEAGDLFATKATARNKPPNTARRKGA